MKKRESLRLKMQRKSENMTQRQKNRILQRKMREVNLLVEMSLDNRRKKLQKQKRESAKKTKKSKSQNQKLKQTPKKKSQKSKLQRKRISKSVGKKNLSQKKLESMATSKTRGRSKTSKKPKKNALKRKLTKPPKRKKRKTSKPKIKKQQIKNEVENEYEELDCMELITNIKKEVEKPSSKKVSKKIQKKRKSGKKSTKKKKNEVAKQKKIKKIERAKKVNIREAKKNVKKRGRPKGSKAISKPKLKSLKKEKKTKKIAKKTQSQKPEKKIEKKSIRKRKARGKKKSIAKIKKSVLSQNKMNKNHSEKLKIENSRIAEPVSPHEIRFKMSETSEESDFTNFKHPKQESLDEESDIQRKEEVEKEDLLKDEMSLTDLLNPTKKPKIQMTPTKNLQTQKDFESEEEEEDFGIIDVLDLMPKSTKKARPGPKRDFQLHPGVESSGNYTGVCEEQISETEEDSELDDEMVDNDVNLLGFNDLLKTYHRVDIKEGDTDDDLEEEEDSDSQLSGNRIGIGMETSGQKSFELIGGVCLNPKLKDLSKNQSLLKKIHNEDVFNQNYSEPAVSKDFVSILKSPKVGLRIFDNTFQNFEETQANIKNSNIINEKKKGKNSLKSKIEWKTELSENKNFEEEEEDFEQNKENNKSISENLIEEESLSRNETSNHELNEPIQPEEADSLKPENHTSNQKSCKGSIDSPGNLKKTDSNKSTTIRIPQTIEKEKTPISLFNNAHMNSEKKAFNGNLLGSKPISRLSDRKSEKKSLEFEKSSKKADSEFKLKKRRKKSRELLQAENLRNQSRFIRENFTSQGKIRRAIPENVQKLFETSREVADLGFKESGGKRCGPKDEDIIKIQKNQIEEEEDESESQKIVEEQISIKEEKENVDNKNEIEEESSVSKEDVNQNQIEEEKPIKPETKKNIFKAEYTKPIFEKDSKLSAALPKLKNRTDVSDLISKLRLKKKNVKKPQSNFCKMGKVGFREKFQDLLSPTHQLPLSSDFNRLLTKFKMTTVLVNLFARKSITPFWSDIASNMMATYRLKVDHSDLKRMIKVLPGCFDLEWSLNDKINDYDLVLYFPDDSFMGSGNSGNGKSHLQASRAWQVHLMQQKFKGKRLVIFFIF